MRLVDPYIYKTIEVTSDTSMQLKGTSCVLPIGPNPRGIHLEDGINTITGWPLYYHFPNISYETRYKLDQTMLLEDLAISNAQIMIPEFYSSGFDRMIDQSISFDISNLSVGINLCVPGGRVSIEGAETHAVLNNINVVTKDGPYVHSNQVALTDPTSSDITNHHIVKYGALDRGYGRMRHGWFWADVSGEWAFSVDGLDVAEIVIDDGVVSAKYTNSAIAGQDVLNDTVDLGVGWHHLFAYTSDNANTTYPTVRFKRPGDPSFSNLTNDDTDGLVWNRSCVIPTKLILQENAGEITATSYYDGDNNILLTFDASELIDGFVSLTKNTIPRYRPYYEYSWKESSLNMSSSTDSNPPKFENMRMVAEYDPITEIIIYLEHTNMSDYSPSFLVSHSETLSWFKWNGSSFELDPVDSVQSLQDTGNSVFELNNISKSDWESFLPSGGRRMISLMFTNDAPLFMTYHRRLFDGITDAEYLVGTSNSISGKTKFERRQI